MPLLIEERKNPDVRNVEAEPAKEMLLREIPKAFLIPEGLVFVEQWSSQVEADQLILTKDVPKQLLARYQDIAMKNVKLKQLDDQTWFAEIPGFDGIWANAENQRDCLNVLHEVLFDWLLIKIQQGDQDIPVLERINLNII